MSVAARTVHLAVKVESLRAVRDELRVAEAFLNYRQATVVFKEGFSSFWVTPEGKMLELEISPTPDGWQIILLE